MPTSEKRIAANRANARKSMGPGSEAGKRRSSRNLTRHGILANALLVDNESRPAFLELLNSFNADFSPVSHIQESLVDKMAASHWRLLRQSTLESAQIIDETRRRADTTADVNAPARTMFAFRALGDTRHLDLMSGRYGHRYDRIQEAESPARNRPTGPLKPKGRPNETIPPAGPANPRSRAMPAVRLPPAVPCQPVKPITTGTPVK